MPGRKGPAPPARRHPGRRPRRRHRRSGTRSMARRASESEIPACTDRPEPFCGRRGRCGVSPWYSPGPKPRQKYLNTSYRKKLTFIEGWNLDMPARVSLVGTLVGAGQPAHGEFDGAIRQFAPAFDGAHIGGLGVAGEEIARLGPRLFARQGEGLAQIAIVRFAPAGHPVCQIARARDHVATPGTHNDRLNIARAETNPS